MLLLHLLLLLLLLLLMLTRLIGQGSRQLKKKRLVRI